LAGWEFAYITSLGGRNENDSDVCAFDSDSRTLEEKMKTSMRLFIGSIFLVSAVSNISHQALQREAVQACTTQSEISLFPEHAARILAMCKANPKWNEQIDIIATATAVLRVAPEMSDSTRADLWDIFVKSADSKQLARQLVAVQTPTTLKAALVSARDGLIPVNITATDVSREKLGLMDSMLKDLAMRKP
jgi:hypothetical protein